MILCNLSHETNTWNCPVEIILSATCLQKQATGLELVKQLICIKLWHDTYFHFQLLKGKSHFSEAHCCFSGGIFWHHCSIADGAVILVLGIEYLPGAVFWQVMCSGKVTLCMAPLGMNLVLVPESLQTVHFHPHLFRAEVLYLTPGVKSRFLYMEKTLQVGDEERYLNVLTSHRGRERGQYFMLELCKLTS